MFEKSMVHKSIAPAYRLHSASGPKRASSSSRTETLSWTCALGRRAQKKPGGSDTWGAVAQRNHCA